MSMSMPIPIPMSHILLPLNKTVQDKCPVRITVATPSDAPAITAVVSAAFSKYIPRLGRLPVPMTVDYDRLLRAPGCTVFILVASQRGSDFGSGLGPSTTSPGDSDSDNSSPSSTPSARSESGAVSESEDDSTPNSILATMTLRTTPNNTFQINNFAVCPEAQGRGYARLLIEFALNKAHRTGRGAVELFTNEAFEENIGMYKKLGFTELGRGCDGYRKVYFRKEV
ncbi:acyl-CoA N-acyltransferase [Aspergillus multicolor]|uniref:acyl-CoA N-acyltransferase n=1 Tax=Aspergillus multicolor TaxID=41759 RepID=UPI003CCD8E97